MLSGTMLCWCIARKLIGQLLSPSAPRPPCQVGWPFTLLQYVHVQLGTYGRLDISCYTREHVYGSFLSLNCCLCTLMQKPKHIAGIVGRQLTLSKRSSTMARHSQSLPRGLSIDPGSVPRQFEDITSPLGSDVALMRRRSMSMGQTPRSRVGLLRLMSRGQDVSRDVKYAALPMLCCLCCAV